MGPVCQGTQKRKEMCALEERSQGDRTRREVCMQAEGTQAWCWHKAAGNEREELEWLGRGVGARPALNTAEGRAWKEISSYGITQFKIKNHDLPVPRTHQALSAENKKGTWDPRRIRNDE